MFIKPEEVSEHFCPICAGHYCLACKTEMHIGKTCIEYKANIINTSHSKNDELAVDLLINVIKAKQCP